MRSGEMTQGRKCWLHKCKEPSSNPKNPYKVECGGTSLRSQCSSFAKTEGRQGNPWKVEAREQCQMKREKAKTCHLKS